MTPTTDPATMTAEERLDAVAAILAVGILRLREKQKTERIPLDISPETRPHVRKTTPNGERR